ncbi:MAG TPA: hypothetical protein VM935_07660 [Chitinophagaceae bacterium]|nr:hypothetical protein [Chitinophagaceae bacterium]
MSKITTIRAEKDSLFSLLKNKNQWHRWHPAYMQPSAGNSLVISIQVLAENDSILQVQWQQPGKKPILNEWRLFNGTGDDASLQWSMTLNTAWYPWEKLGVLMYEPTYGKMMEEGLANIKKGLEH